MEINHYRYNSALDHTNGLWLIDGKFMCYTLEDEYRNRKVYGETRIPAGRYKITLRTEGTIHQRYLHKFGSKFHKGTLWLQDVPNFKWILIHIGNDDEDTAGCILVGQDPKGSDNFIANSTAAYKKIYPPIRDAILSGEEVFINVIDLDNPKK